MTNLLKVYKVDFQLFLRGGFCMTIFMEKATSHGCNNYNDPKYQGVSDLIWVWVKIRYPNNWMVNTKLD